MLEFVVKAATILPYSLPTVKDNQNGQHDVSGKDSLYSLVQKDGTAEG